MGLLDRIRGKRTEEQKRLWDYAADLTAPPTYMSPLVTGQIWKCDDKKHQLEVATKDAVANYIIVKIAENVFDDWFVLKRLNDEGELEDHPDNKKIQKEFKSMKAKKWLTQTLIGERTHGDSLLYTGSNVYREDYDEGYQLANLDVFTPLYFDLPKDKHDEKTGRPTIVRIFPNPSNRAIYDDEPYNDFIHFITRPKGREWAGYSAIYSAWIDLAYIRLSKHSQSWVDAKHGLGLFLWFVNRLTDETEEALEEMLEEVSISRAGIIDSTLVDDVKWIGPPSGAGARINESIDMLLGLVSAATGVPKDILIGISAGAITGSEVNNKALYATLNQIQMSMEPYILELVKRMGYENDYEIDWNTRYATDELEQAQIRLLNAQSAQMEALAEQGRGENDIMIDLKTGEEEEHTRNKEGLQA